VSIVTQLHQLSALAHLGLRGTNG